MRVAGPVRGLLTAERTALNFASHLSGVATATAAWVDALEGTRARVLDTRKTLPGYRALQKYAVRCGGGVNHRFSLSDMAMAKDNHVLAAGGVVPAYEAVRAAYPGLRVEVEVTDLDQLRELLGVGCREILLDNMSTETMAEAVRLTDGRATLEASGGLTIERAREVAETGVDFISVGALTHSVRVFDLGMDFGGVIAEWRCWPPTSATATPSSGSSSTARSSPTGGCRPTLAGPPTSGRCCSAACSATRWTSPGSRSARPCRRCCTSGATCSSSTSPAFRTSSSSRACAPAYRC